MKHFIAESLSRFQDLHLNSPTTTSVPKFIFYNTAKNDTFLKYYNRRKNMEMRGIEPRAFHMQSEHSTTELHPHIQI